MRIEVVREEPVRPPVIEVVLRLTRSEFDVLQNELADWANRSIPCIRTIIESRLW